MSKIFHYPIRIYIEDTDAGGIVYYVNYLKFMERARTECLRNLGYGKAAIFDDDLLMVVHSVEVKYLAPAYLDDEVSVTANIIKLARTYILFDQQVCRGQQVLCQAKVKIACVTSAMKPTPLPDGIIDSIQRSGYTSAQ